MKLPIGTSDFKEVIKENYTFIDKSLLIKDIIDDSAKVILLTRPRRFGKTLSMSMLQYFFNMNEQSEKNLFANLLISQAGQNYLKHQNQYPVIYLTFKDIKERNFSDTLESFVVLFSDLYIQHRFLLEGNYLDSDKAITFRSIIERKAILKDLKNSLKNLSEYLTGYYGKKPIILIDEYDSPIHAAYLNNHYEETIDFMRGLFSGGLKDNSHLYKGILTGILRVSKESLFSGVNNLAVYSVLQSRYGQYFGFTEEEVKQVWQLSQSDDSANSNFKLSDLRTWYNGYQFGKVTIYNPWSVLNYFYREGELTTYWGNTADDSLLGSLLVKSDYAMKEKLMSLLQNKSVNEIVDEHIVMKDLKQHPSALWSFLLMTGYLKTIHSKYIKGEKACELAIPNLEVHYLYDRLIKRWLVDVSNHDTYLRFLKDLTTGNIESFGKQLENYLLQTFSYFDFPKNALEQTYHVFMLGLVAGLSETHLIKSNRESGYGRYDVMIIPLDKNRKPVNDSKRPALLMEFKVPDPKSKNENLENLLKQAMTQMQDKQYQSEIKELGLNHIVLIAIVFNGKEVYCQCLNDK